MKLLRRLLIRAPNLSGLKPGEAGEEWVCYLYRRNGWKIIARNYTLYGRKKLGEIDIVCQNRRRLCLVEVRTRRDENFMAIVESVDWRKQSYLRRMAKMFLQRHPEFENHFIQIDVVAVLLDPVDNFVKSVKIVENAVEDSD